MTGLRVVGFLNKDAASDDGSHICQSDFFPRFMPNTCTVPLVSLPAVVESLDRCHSSGDYEALIEQLRALKESA